MSASAGVPKQKDGLAVPPRPKKPLTPYFRFLAQVREDAKKENPKLKITGEFTYLIKYLNFLGIMINFGCWMIQS